jgi:hypothetical protein
MNTLPEIEQYFEEVRAFARSIQDDPIKSIAAECGI